MCLCFWLKMLLYTTYSITNVCWQVYGCVNCSYPYMLAVNYLLCIFKRIHKLVNLVASNFRSPYKYTSILKALTVLKYAYLILPPIAWQVLQSFGALQIHFSWLFIFEQILLIVHSLQVPEVWSILIPLQASVSQ